MDIVGVIAVVALIVGIAASLVTVATFFYQVPQARQRFLRHRRLVIVISLLLALIGAGIYVAGPTHVDEFKLQPFGGRLQHLVTLPDGSVWFTDANGNRIVDASAEGALTRYVVQYQDSMPIGITIGPDNNLWIAEEKGARIEAKDRSGNTITTIPIPFKDSRPQFITLGPDRNLWFTDHGTHSIGRVKIDVLPVTRASIFVVDEYSLGPTADPVAITAGLDDNLWFTDAGRSLVGRLNPYAPTTDLKEFPVDKGSSPSGIAADDNGNIWFTEANGNRIGRIDTNEKLQVKELPQRGSGPGFIAAGPDDTMWFTETNGNRIGRIDQSFNIKEYGIPTDKSEPFGIAIGSNGTIWFTEAKGGKLGHLIPFLPGRF
jgi:virginiamycin B lyase